MKKYDLFTIIKPNLDNDEADKVVARVEDIVKSLGGSVSDCDKMGRKKLAYDLQGYRDGYFTTMIVSLPADAIVEFKRNLKLNENVLRFMFMEVSKKSGVSA